MPKTALPQVPPDIIDLVARAVNQGFRRIRNDSGDLFGPGRYLELTEGVRDLFGELHQANTDNERLALLNDAEGQLRDGLSLWSQQGRQPTPVKINEYINWLIVLFLITYYQGENEKARKNANKAKGRGMKEPRRTPSRSAKAASIMNALVDHLLPIHGCQAFGVYLALSANLHLLSRPAEKDKLKDQIAIEVAKSLDKLPPLPLTDIFLFPIFVITYISVTNGVSIQTICERLGLGNLAPIVKVDEEKLLKTDEPRAVMANLNGMDEDVSIFIKPHLKSARLFDASAHHDVGSIESVPDGGEPGQPYHPRTTTEGVEHQPPMGDNVSLEMTAGQPRERPEELRDVSEWNEQPGRLTFRTYEQLNWS